MPRLFKKFFVIIWLTLAASAAVIILIVNLFQTPPFAPKLERQKREIVLNLTENLLAKDGEDAALRFARTSEDTVPLGLTISRIVESGACADSNTAETRTVMKDGICYRISVSRQASFILDKLAPSLLWVAIFVSSTISAAALARYLIRPVAHLRDGLSALAHGRFDVRIGDKMARRKDEVSALAHDFDSTAARLQELQDAQQGLFHDVS
ncbi:MAG TPA: HAMP domain-containing protein, partial [Sinorhizobium sp.]|nr:HAMP domain-containing protein [Sinorhizobium sp.]